MIVTTAEDLNRARKLCALNALPAGSDFETILADEFAKIRYETRKAVIEEATDIAAEIEYNHPSISNAIRRCMKP